MDEVMVLAGFDSSCAKHCMYGRAGTGTNEPCSRPGGCGLDTDYIYMRPVAALHFKLTGEVNHVLDHDPQTANAPIVR